MQGSEIAVIPEWIVLAFLFAIGGCVGSFLNVVIYRLPRDKSLVYPPSSCPSCGKHIRFYDNIPLVSWLVLLGKCRNCKARISPRYFVVELLTAAVFVGMYIFYFDTGLRADIPEFLAGGWFVYLATVILLSALVACSAIDLEMWIIPLSVCWFATAAGIVASTLAPLAIHPAVIGKYFLLPTTTAFIFINPTTVATLTAGALIGLVISLVLLETGLIKRSYDIGKLKDSSENSPKQDATTSMQGVEDEFNDRAEMFKEMVFLLPIIVFAIAAYKLMGRFPAIQQWWGGFTQWPYVSGFLGSLAGYFAGCTIVWFFRIFGTLLFGREAMGLGDVHLMGAAGAVIGPVFIVIAFFLRLFSVWPRRGYG